MQGVPYREKIEQGIMIETPAAVMISDILAKEVDFFSIGTNDLTQYTLAIDRQNPKLDAFYDAHHEGLLRMIEMVVKNAHQENIWVGICGELGADQELCKRFLQMGIDELSVSPSLILPLRKHIRQLNIQE
jgi:phosphoenolpyruvate-protein phosphotransferase (PTS system enzyme I)